MKHKCDGCQYKGEHQEMGFISTGVCGRERNLADAIKAYESNKCPYKKMQTNYDRLNAMSVEEKALWLYHGQDPITGPLNLQGILDWLNSPAEGE
jgi:hypothetical protein